MGEPIVEKKQSMPFGGESSEEMREKGAARANRRGWSGREGVGW